MSNKTRIFNAASVPLNQQPQGTVPDVSGALTDWMQPIVFILISTEVQGFQALRTGTAINFQGNLQPFSARQLYLRPEGERAWSWYYLHAPLGMPLAVGDVVNYKGRQFRVMAKKDQQLGGFVEFQIVTDWTGSGPIVGGQSR